MHVYSQLQQPEKEEDARPHTKKNNNQLQLKAIPPARLAILPYSLFISSDDYYVYSTGDNSPIFISGGGDQTGQGRDPQMQNYLPKMNSIGGRWIFLLCFNS